MYVFWWKILVNSYSFQESHPLKNSFQVDKCKVLQCVHKKSFIGLVPLILGLSLKKSGKSYANKLIFQEHNALENTTLSVSFERVEIPTCTIINKAFKINYYFNIYSNFLLWSLFFFVLVLPSQTTCRYVFDPTLLLFIKTHNIM